MNYDLIIIGGGPAGLAAAERAADLGANVCLVTADVIGGMAAHDGPIPVRTLAYAARLIREAQQHEKYGIYSSKPEINYEKLLNRIQSVVFGMHQQLNLFDDLRSSGVTIYERTGPARFVDPHTIETASGLLLHGKKFIICTGGHSRTLPIPGFELTVTHSDAWSLKNIPKSMIVVGAGATGAQVASIFNAFGTEVSLFEAAPRILWTEDEDVSIAVKKAFERHGVYVLEGFDGIDRIEESADGRRLHFKNKGESEYKDAELIVMAIGWAANAEGLNLKDAGVQTDHRGYIQVNRYMETSVPHIYAAGDVNGRTMLVPISSQEGYCAASNAIMGNKFESSYELVPTGSFTDPEYAKIGLTEEQARKNYDVAVATIDFDSFPRSLIDGRPTGFCKLIVDRQSLTILGCHLVGERAVETVQLVATGMKAGLTVDQLADLPLSFPTYVEIVGWAAYDIVKQLGMDGGEPHWAAHSGRGLKKSYDR